MGVRKAVVAIGCAAVVALGVRAAAAQTVDELVARNLEAKGGLEALRGVRTIRQSSRLAIQGMAATLTTYGKRPNLIRQEISLGGQIIVTAFDGTSAWAINPMTGSSQPVQVVGPEVDTIRQQSDFDGPLIDYKAKGTVIELVGAEKLGDRAVHHLKITSSDGRVQHYYLDAATGLEVKVVIETEMGRLEQELSDYREVNGLRVPFAIRTHSNGVLLADIVVDKVEFNLALDDALFRLR